MHNPFLAATRRVIRRVGRYSPASINTGEGDVFVIPAVWSNNEETGEIRKVGKGSGGRDFKASGKRLRVLTEDVIGVCQEWEITVGGVKYFAADWDHLDEGATLLYLAPWQATTNPEVDPHGWR